MDKLNIKDIVDDSYFAYIGDDILLGSDLKSLPPVLMNVNLGFEFVILCEQGVFQITVDTTTYKVSGGQMLVVTEDTTVHEFLVSQDVSLAVIGFSWSLLEDTTHLNAALWPMVDYVADKPITELSADEFEAMDGYVKHMARIASSDNDLYKDELMHNAVRSLVYEYIRMNSFITRHENSGESKRSEQIMRKFYDILATAHGRIHSVTDVAGILNLTPKYLSKVIREETGNNPLSIIHQYTMNEIKQQLTYSDNTMKEIAVLLHFNSLAFFGKFVRQQSGLSPKALRDRLRKENEKMK